VEEGGSSQNMNERAEKQSAGGAQISGRRGWADEGSDGKSWGKRRNLNPVCGSQNGRAFRVGSGRLEILDDRDGGTSRAKFEFDEPGLSFFNQNDDKFRPSAHTPRDQDSVRSTKGRAQVCEQDVESQK
jgi:hypothetical protein